MKYNFLILIILISFTEVGCQAKSTNQKVFFGDELLLKKNLHLLQNKSIGIVTNQTAVLPNKIHLIDTLLSLGLKIKVLFSPEHGIKGNLTAGESISSLSDSISGTPVYSLYGDNKTISKEMLKDIDIILYDIQDVGARFYTYISTLYYVLQSAGKNNIPVIILDRPNPLGGSKIEGPVLESAYESFVGIAQIPIIYGMTAGELANYFVNESIKTEKKTELTVIKIRGWYRNNYWDDLGREWIPTSPNIPNFETSTVYPGTCLIEGTNVSEGRGTDNPFLTIGAPFINSKDLIHALNLFHSEGISYTAATFTPVDIKGKASNPKYRGIECYGIVISVTDKKKFNAIEFGVQLIYTLLKLYPEQFQFNSKHFDLLAGSDRLRKDLLAGKTPSDIFDSWNSELNKFKSTRKKYLLY
jgi:uncharacterized protein YbbC (DUF1343 family)